jgi:phosphonate ABC transporter permease subunit PhnE
MQVPLIEPVAEQPGRRRFQFRRSAWVTILGAIVIFLVYAYAVQATQINLERPLDPGRQANLLRVLRLLADPDIFRVDEETGGIVASETLAITLDRMVETILMALLASTVGTLLAMPISFLAARNLMEGATAPLAAIMGAVLLLAAGASAGSRIGGLVTDWAGDLAAQPWLALALLAIALALAYLGLRRVADPASDLKATRASRASSLLKLAAIVALALFSLALAAELSFQAGEWLEANLGALGFLGNFLTVVADFVMLTLPALIGLIGAGIGSVLGSRYGLELVLRLPVAPARLLTAGLTAAGLFVFVYGIGSALNWLYQFVDPQNWTLYPALVAAGLGALVGLVARPNRPYPIGAVIYFVTRSILNFLRAIEPLIMGIVFVVWVGLGPFAGIMALTLHSIAALGKLFSEQVEGIAEGPVEAIRATGANALQTVVYGVIPQIVPPFIAFALYRWDINVRMSTIIGFVGGGGIGFVLSQNIQLLRYRQASVMMLAIAVVVALLDYASSQIRRRII